MAVESMEKIVALAKNRGFVYPGSEISPAPKFTAVWQIHGITALWVLN